MSPTFYPEPRPEPPQQPQRPIQTPPPLYTEPVVEGYESPFPEPEAAPEPGDRPVAYRGSTSDPVFGYLIAVALGIGLTPLNATNPDLRYVIIWMVMAGFGVLSWLLGSSARIDQEKPENLAWGIIFGLIIGLPLLFVGGSTLQETVRRLFVNMSTGEVLAFLIFVMPLSETLFFRGVLQENRPFWIVGALSTFWSMLVFFPLLDIGRYPAVGAVIGTALVMMNIIYAYVRRRNGLAAAWVCQIVTNFVLLFLAFI